MFFLLSGLLKVYNKTTGRIYTINLYNLKKYIKLLCISMKKNLYILYSSFIFLYIFGDHRQAESDVTRNHSAILR